MYQKVAIMVVTIVIYHFVDGLPVARIEDSDKYGAIKTIPADESNRLDPSFDISIERGHYGGADSPGIVIGASVNQKQASQETFVHSLSEDNSTVTMSGGIVRQQSDDDIKSSDIYALNLSILPDVSVGGRL
ncbi:uncharacterized protein LOC141849502 [Brevipalpus obovatus]|uniref:uncharacterized protein LOC141849502 n=1 Tax=Brevipalpus obovatus TaxID=246614 RepID=UPI003D9E073F